MIRCVFVVVRVVVVVIIVVMKPATIVRLMPYKHIHRQTDSYWLKLLMIKMEHIILNTLYGRSDGRSVARIVASGQKTDDADDTNDRNIIIHLTPKK